MIGENEEEAQRITSQLKIIGRAIYSNPPLHGARIVSTVLNSDNLREMWFGDVKEMADRIISMRQGLRQGLQNAGSQL